MKKTIYAFAVLSSLFLVACGGDNAKDASGEDAEKSSEGAEKEEEKGPSIVGTWDLVDVDMGMEIPEDQQDMYDAMVDQLKEHTSYTFNEDGTMISNSFVGEPVEQKGTYKLEGDKLNVDMEGQSDTIKVDLSEEALVMHIDAGGNSMKMTFTRK